MTKTRIILLFIGATISLPASIYAFMSVVLYSWLEGSQQWTAEKTAIWAIGSLILCIVFLIIFIVCIVKAVRGINKNYAEKKRDV